jgi:hypothetical protein
MRTTACRPSPPHAVPSSTAVAEARRQDLLCEAPGLPAGTMGLRRAVTGPRSRAARGGPVRQRLKRQRMGPHAAAAGPWAAPWLLLVLPAPLHAALDDAAGASWGPATRSGCMAPPKPCGARADAPSARRTQTSLPPRAQGCSAAALRGVPAGAGRRRALNAATARRPAGAGRGPPHGSHACARTQRLACAPSSPGEPGCTERAHALDAPGRRAARGGRAARSTAAAARPARPAAAAAAGARWGGR